MTKVKPESKQNVSIFRKFLFVGEAIYSFIERNLNKGFGEKHNWFYYLGAIPVLLMLILLFSGLYLFIYYDLSLNNAYDSVKNITEISLFGNLMRSMHRYSADALILFGILHLLRMFFKRRYQNHRWLAWVSGIFILTFLLIQGITGYILPLDSTANFVMQQTATLLSAVKIFGNTLSRSFASPGNSGKWIMWIMMIIHLAIPMLILFALFIHVKRVSRARILPPKRIIWGSIILLVLFSMIFPVEMLDRANPYKQVYLQEINWFYLFLAPLMKSETSLIIWSGFFCVIALFLVTPWLSKSEKINSIQLDLPSCTGCTLCAQDCPYEAIAMNPRSDGMDHKFEAVISEKLCSGCGICIGSCAFDALSLKQQTVEQPLQEIRELFQNKLQNTDHYLGLVCNKMAPFLPDNKLGFDSSEVAILRLECVGKFSISMFEESKKAGVCGIIAYSCSEGDCNFREGNKWFEERMNSNRKPRYSRIHDAPPMAMTHVCDKNSILGQTKKIIHEMKKEPKQPIVNRILGGQIISLIVSFISIILIGATLYFGSAGSTKTIALDTSKAIIRLDFFYKTEQKTCDPSALNPEEYLKAEKRLTNRVKMENLTPEAQKRLKDAARANALSRFCSRARKPLKVRLFLNNEIKLTRTFYPSGLQNDGLVYVLYELSVEPGQYQLKLETYDDENVVINNYEIDKELKGAQKFFIDFNKNQSRFIGR